LIKRINIIDTIGQGIAPVLQFDTEAEAAEQLEVTVLGNAKIRDTARYGDAGTGAGHDAD
jgi:predicted 3-demethylubiquinone-9 3-methyltransferase (glyoxalase superfamily)